MAKKKPALVAQPRGAPRRDYRWSGNQELTSGERQRESLCWYMGADVQDAGDEREHDKPASKKQNAHRWFQKTSWVALLLWMFVVADGEAAACSRAGVGCPGCADCSKVLCYVALGGIVRIFELRTRAAIRSTTTAVVASGLMPYEITATSTTVSSWTGRSPAS